MFDKLNGIYSFLSALNPILIICGLVAAVLIVVNAYKFLRYGRKCLGFASRLLNGAIAGCAVGVVLVVLSIGEVCSFRNINFALDLDAFVSRHMVFYLLLNTIISGFYMVTKIAFLLLVTLRFTERTAIVVEPYKSYDREEFISCFHNPSPILLQ
ncbi:MAG: hypothetical protein LBE09_06360 [Christensenellaceae bacterium]|jgi:hypothetical protein|nr:hypothetical protein [Christensenellaceae bacterium]